jgi:hypothetical protein
MIEHIGNDEQKADKTTAPVEYHFHQKLKEKTEPSALIDLFTTALIVLISVGVIATYFITFNVHTNVSVKSMTVNTLWFAVGTFSIGMLGKRVFRRKGEKTKAYIEAEDKARKAIEELNASEYANCVGEYCRQYTERVIKDYRRHLLVTVGIEENVFETEYLGKGLGFLWQKWRQKELSFLQARAIWKCNHVKIKAYDPNFITSYYAEPNVVNVPSAQNDTQTANSRDNIKSILFVMCSAFGVGFMFSDVVLHFSGAVLFEAIIKLVTIGVNLALKATTGWNLSVMEIRRNYQRASEATACLKWAKDQL